jgi:hypothetical protein
MAGTWAGLGWSRSATGLTCAGVCTYWVGSIFEHHATPVPSRNMLYVRLELHVRSRFANVLNADLVLHNDRAVTSPVKIAAPHQAI